MATVGFNVSDEVKQKIDKAADDFVAESGGKKSDFVTAMLDLWSETQAKSALPGRKEEIERFEALMAAIRQSYLYSLSVADGAIRDKADVASEIDAIRTAVKQRDLDAVALREEIISLKDALAKATAERDKYVTTFVAATEQLQAKAAQADKYAADLAQYQAQVSNLNAQLSAMDRLLTPKQREKLSLNNVVNDV